MNTSPDLPAQIESFPPLQPRVHPARNSPIAAICLSNADIDHALGLALLRERESLVVYATPAIRDELRWIDNLLVRFCRIDWREPSSEFARAIPNVDLRIVAGSADAAYVVRDATTQKQALIAPAVRNFTDELGEAMQHAEAILFDGTFWSDDELKPFRANARTAREMGHIPVQETLPLLEAAPAAHKIYVHINNTNPILQSSAPERKAVERAGIVVATDGVELNI
jgi:pyrroloquinoline quinone biosynthesis protein B